MKKTHKTITYANSGVNIKKADKLSLDYVTIEQGRLIWNINYNK